MSIAASDPATNPRPAREAMAQGPGARAWLAVVAAIGVGLLAVAMTPEPSMRWSLLAVMVAVIPMVPTTMVLALMRRRRPVFELWQTAIALSGLRSLASLSAAGAVLWLTDAPTNPFVLVFLLVAGVALATEKLIILGTSHVAVCRSNA